MRACRLAAWLWLSLVMPGTAHAEPLSFTAPPDCGSAEELITRVSAVLGQPADVTADVAITHESDAEFILSVTLSGEARIVSDRACRALFESAVLMIALHMRPQTESKAAPALEVTPPQQPPEAQRPQVQASAPVPHTSFYRALWLDAGAVHGVVPDWDLSLGLGTQIGGKGLRFAASLHYSPPRDDPQQRVAIQSVGARALLIVAAPALGWLGVGVAGDLLIGRGEHLSATRRDTITRTGACFELGAILFTHGPHQLALASDLTLAPERARFRAHREQPAGASEVLYRPGFWGFSADLRWQLQIAR